MERQSLKLKLLEVTLNSEELELKHQTELKSNSGLKFELALNSDLNLQMTSNSGLNFERTLNFHLNSGSVLNSDQLLNLLESQSTLNSAMKSFQALENFAKPMVDQLSSLEVLQLI